MFINYLILQILCLHNIYSLVESNVIVKTSTGPIKGKLAYYGNTVYISYLGIPYAQPPIGDLRFMPPVPVKPWKNVYEAVETGCACPQMEYFHLRHEMDENCLFLNIYVPVTKSTKLLPVVFYIHGGAYSFHSARSSPLHGPELLMAKDIILVIVNYRIGALGFLSLETPNASGNAGLKDIILALQWVSSNIQSFGGDPKSLCIAGQGSGGSLVHYLMLTNQTTGCFQSAAIYGSSATNYKFIQQSPIENAQKLAQCMGLKYSNKDSLLKALKKADSFDIVDAQEYLIRNSPQRAYSIRDLFSPSIEKPSTHAIITKKPIDIIREEGVTNPVPSIFGFNINEGLEGFAVNKFEPEKVEILNENSELLIPPDIRYDDYPEKRRNLANEIKKRYFNGGNITIYNTQNYINLLTDTTDSYSIDSWIKTYKEITNCGPLYYYKCEFDGDLNWGKLVFDINYSGPSHGDELGYLFLTNITRSKIKDLEPNSKMIMNSMITTLKNLALYGNPNGKNLDNFPWPETGSNRTHLVFSKKIKQVNEPPLQDRINFWYEKYSEYKRCIGV